jgi:molybdenum cofactor guanylyltransferase
MRYGAVILAGGAGRRLGGPGKPALLVRGQRMVDRVLAAVADAAPQVVVGPPDLSLPAGVLRTREEPPGGGPVAAAAAGLSLVDATEVALLAADLPFLTGAAVEALRRARADGAVFVDGTGRRQILCGVWRTAALRDRLASIAPGGLAGVPLHRLLDGLAVVEVAWGEAGAPPWYDCDTDAELERAEGWGQ